MKFSDGFKFLTRYNIEPIFIELENEIKSKVKSRRQLIYSPTGFIPNDKSITILGDVNAEIRPHYLGKADELNSNSSYSYSNCLKLDPIAFLSADFIIKFDFDDSGITRTHTLGASLTQMPHCCGACIINNLYTSGELIGNKLGSMLINTLVKLARAVNYSYILGTDVSNGRGYKCFMEQEGSKVLDTFKNKRSSHTLSLVAIDLTK